MIEVKKNGQRNAGLKLVGVVPTPTPLLGAAVSRRGNIRRLVAKDAATMDRLIRQYLLTGYKLVS